MLVPVICWNMAAVRCEVEPLPCEAKVTLPGCALASAIRSFTLAAGRLVRTASTLIVVPRSEIGVNRVGSYASFL